MLIMRIVNVRFVCCLVVPILLFCVFFAKTKKSNNRVIVCASYTYDFCMTFTMSTCSSDRGIV